MSDFVKFFHNVPAQRPPDPKNGKGAIGEMFGGRLALSRPRFAPTQTTYRFDGMEIPIRRASSGIVETAPFQLFQSGTPRADVLVFEEPEAHLHPANQARLAKHIARLVNDGTHAILVTHSAHFLEQLYRRAKVRTLFYGLFTRVYGLKHRKTRGGLMHAGISLFLKMCRLTPGKRQKMKYGPNDFLRNDDVCPYVFKTDTKGGYAMHKIKHSVADGISQDEFIHTIECMYEEDLDSRAKVFGGFCPFWIASSCLWGCATLRKRASAPGRRHVSQIAGLRRGRAPAAPARRAAPPPFYSDPATIVHKPDRFCQPCLAAGLADPGAAPRG